jgi:two-component system NtrC family sensor kinase
VADPAAPDRRRRDVDPALIQSEKLSALGRMVAAIAHEINNPLTTVLGQAQLVLARPAIEPDLRDRVTTIAEEAFRASRIVENLLLFVRHQAPERRPCRLAEEIDWVLRMTQRLLEQDEVEVLREIADCAPVWVDQNQLRQVLLNLVQNAHHSLRAVARRRLVIRAFERDGQAVIEVSDNGPGIARSALPRIFDPFFTTKAPSEGTGLGLWVSLSIVEQHGGTLTATNLAEGGAVFTVTLPYRRRRR